MPIPFAADSTSTANTKPNSPCRPANDPGEVEIDAGPTILIRD
jgi:hypothetical protein